MIDARAIERARAADHAIDLVVLLEQDLGKVRAVLAGDAGNERFALHQRTRGGAGSPCASCQETTGLRNTPILSISASITSPGRRYSDAASSLKAATPLTVPVETTSPAA